ncbi:unnamed protein product, partial [Rotaria sp. Silwood2]
MKHQAPS